MNFVRFTTALWSSASTPKRRPLAAIIIPDSAKEKPSQGEITAVGQVAVTKRQADPDRSQGWRPRAVRQMVRHRGQARWSGTADHEGERHHGRSH